MGLIKILLVDDVKLTLEIAKSALTNSGSVILTAANGVEALEVVKKEKPDLILMDLFMPEMNGDECCRLIKDDPSSYNIPVVFISSPTRLAALDKATLSLSDGILKKPFNKGEFLEKVNEYVDIKCRNHNRLKVNYDVAFKHGDRISHGRMTNLSQGGVYIESEDILPAGTKVDIAVTTKKVGCIELFGKVVWSASNPKDSQRESNRGMGVKFLDPDSSFLEKIEALCGKLGSSLNPA